MAVNKSNNDEVLSGMFEHIVSSSLQKGETKEAMLKKFDGNKIELIKFLRDRDYKEWIKSNKKQADTSEIINKINALMKQHQEDIANGSLRLYDMPRVKEEEVVPASSMTPKSKSKSTPEKTEAPKAEVKKEVKPVVKYIEPPATKKKWSKKKEKPVQDKNQESLF